MRGGSEAGRWLEQLEARGKGCVAGVQGEGRGAGVLEKVPMVRPAVKVISERKGGGRGWDTGSLGRAQRHMGTRLHFVKSVFH